MTRFMGSIFVHAEEVCVGQNKVANPMRGPPRAATWLKAVVVVGPEDAQQPLQSSALGKIDPVFPLRSMDF